MSGFEEDYFSVSVLTISHLDSVLTWTQTFWDSVSTSPDLGQVLVNCVGNVFYTRVSPFPGVPLVIRKSQPWRNSAVGENQDVVGGVTRHSAHETIHEIGFKRTRQDFNTIFRTI